MNGMETLQRIDGELRAISGLFRGSRTDVKDRLGLPIAAECERRLLAIAAAKAQRKADAARRAEQVKRDRQKEVADHAAKVFSRELLESWLNTPLLDLENRSPHDAAYAGFHGAAKARDIIFAIERQKQSEDAREGEATFWRDKLRKTVGLRLRDDEAEAFLNDRDEDYKRAKAVVFCRDKRTYNVVIRKLDAWTNAFGSGRGV